MKDVRCESEYPKPLSGEVTLDVIVGEGQMGAILVLLDDVEIAKGDNQLEDVPLGSAGQLVTRRLEVKATVPPVNPRTRRTSVTCRFKSDSGKQEETCSDEDNDGQIVRLIAVFTDG